MADVSSVMPEFSWSCFLFDAESPDDMDMPCMSATDWRRLWFLACSAAASSSSVLPVANGLSPVGDRPDSRRLGFMLIVTEGRRRAAILSAVFFEGWLRPRGPRSSGLPFGGGCAARPTTAAPCAVRRRPKSRGPLLLGERKPVLDSFVTASSF